MALKRGSLSHIVGGITTPETALPPELPASAVEPSPPLAEEKAAAALQAPAGQGSGPAVSRGDAESSEPRRFAKRGRPKGSKPDGQTGSARKVKVSLFLSEIIVNDLYEWAHADRMHPGEMFELALKPFHDRETKRRKTGKE